MSNVLDSLDFLNASIEGSRDKFAAEAPAEGAELYQIQMYEAKVWQDAIKDMIVLKGDIGRQIIAGFWHVLYNDMHTLLGEYNNLVEWVRDVMAQYDEEHTLDDAEQSDIKRNTIIDYASIVERIFPTVFARQNTKNPFKITETIISKDADGNEAEVTIETPVTVEMLMTTRGLIGKLKMFSSHFADAEPETQQNIIQTVITKSKSEAACMRDSIVKGTPTVKLPFRRTRIEDGSWEITLQLNDEQYTLFAIRLKNVGVEIED